MKTLFIAILLVSNISVACKSQNELEKHTNMEKYDFGLMEQFRAGGALNTVVSKGDTLVYVSGMRESGAFYKEYPPAPHFYIVSKKFYPNGQLESCGKYVRHVLFGTWKYYNEDGSFNKMVDEDEKFGKINYEWILKFIEKEGWIDLTTGEGREELIVVDKNQGSIKQSIFSLAFVEVGEEDNDYPFWSVKIISNPETNFYQTLYKIHGETGEVLSKESKELFRTE